MIRRAVVADAQAVTDFLVPRMRAHVLLPIDPEQGFAQVTDVIRAGHAFVAEQKGEIIGTVGYEISSPWYARELAMFDAWMCAPDHPVTAGKLIRTLEREARTLGLPFFAGLSGNLENQRVFEKRYVLCGVMYRKE